MDRDGNSWGACDQSYSVLRKEIEYQMIIWKAYYKWRAYRYGYIMYQGEVHANLNS